MSILDFLTGTSVLEKAESPINGQIEVVRDLTWGTYIKVGGLTQSGGILKQVWKETLSYISKFDLEIKSVLILGLGGGSVATLIRDYWPKAKITGVDIDPLMVGLGKKYLGLGKIDIDIKISDAYDFSGGKYDLVLVDLYNGDKFPEKFGDEKFLKMVKKNLSKGGAAIFNRLYGPEHRTAAMRFGKKLEKEFGKVDYFYPQANVMFIAC